MKLGQIACIHSNMPWADFWVIPSGDQIGRVAVEFNRDYIGVMFTAEAVMKMLVIPKKIAVWWDIITRESGHPPHSVVKHTKDGDIVSPALMKRMRLPTGAVPNEADTI